MDKWRLQLDSAYSKGAGIPFHDVFNGSGDVSRGVNRIGKSLENGRRFCLRNDNQQSHGQMEATA